MRVDRHAADGIDGTLRGRSAAVMQLIVHVTPVLNGNRNM
jgi:hypothetical protein